jgi:hypothetical protein
LREREADVSTQHELRDDVPSWFLDAMSIPAEYVRALEDRETPRQPGWREGPNLKHQSDYHWALEHFPDERMDPGIIRIVRVFQEHGVETCQSCQGGEGHAYTWPTVDIYGQPWKALGVANDHGFPVCAISHYWGVVDGEPVEHLWRVEFSPAKLAPLREQWYAQEARDHAEYLAWVAKHGEPA